MRLLILLLVSIFLILPLTFLWIASLFIDKDQEYETDSPFYRKLLYLGTAVLLYPLRIKVHFTGKEKIPRTKKVMFVYNHVSNFDPILLWQELRRWDIAFLSKEENFKAPIFGRFAKRCCFMAIDRENPREALKTINKAAALLKNKAVSIGASPEGTRSKTGELLPFHDGVFKVAKKADAPVVVVRIRDTEKIRKNVLRRRSDVYYEVVDVIRPGDAEWKNVHMISERARKAMLG